MFNKNKNKRESRTQTQFESQRYSPGATISASRTQEANRVNRKVPKARLSDWKNKININNIEQEKRQKVEKEIAERESIKLKLKKRSRKKKAIVYTLPAVIAWMLICSMSYRYEIKFSGVHPPNKEYTDQFSLAVKDSLPRSGWGFTRYFVPRFINTKSVANRVQKYGNEIESVNTSFNWIKFRTDVVVVNKVPVLEWTVNGERAIYVDRFGRIFEPSSPAYLQGFSVVAAEGSGLEFDPEHPEVPVIGTDRLAFIAAAIPIIQENGLSIASININGQRFKEVEALLGPEQKRVIFSADEDARRSALAAVKAYNHLASKINGVEYIDVSSPDKVTYKSN